MESCRNWNGCRCRPPGATAPIPASRLRFAARTVELGLDLTREVRELAENVDRGLGVVLLGHALELPPSRLEALEQRLRALQRFLGAHRARVPSAPVTTPCIVPRSRPQCPDRAGSRAIRPRIPFTNRAASSLAYRFARRTASSIATSTGTTPDSSSLTAMRRMFRSTAPS